jgi:uncharacterized membrane protein
MNYTIGRHFQFIFGLFIAFFTATPTWAEEAQTQASQWVKPDGWFIYAVLFIVLIGSLITLVVVRAALGSDTSKWSLADALSEEVEITAMETDAAG